MGRFRSSPTDRSRPRLCKNTDENEIVGRLGCPNRVLRSFRRGSNGKSTPENVQVSRFYTAWAKSGRLVALLNKSKRSLNMNERPIPEAALQDQNSVEMLRVWVAGGQLHCSLKIGMYRDAMRIDEETAWGTILADAARHIAKALQDGGDLNETESLAKLVMKFNDELSAPSSELTGGFV